MTLRRFGRQVARGVGLSVGLLALLPATASAHQLTGRYESPLPLAAYLGAAAIAVGLSFAIVILRGRSAAPAVAAETGEQRLVRVPAWLRTGLRAIGLIAWIWIVIEGVVGGTNADTDAGSLFLWTYAWVGLPLLSALVGPVWEWFDPFATLHDLGAAALRRLGRPTWPTAPYPAGWERWPAIGAVVVFIWLELVYTSARGGHVLAIALVLYTAWTLAMMARFGHDTWRRNGEVFSVWLGLLNRIAPFGPADEGATTLRHRRYGQGLLEATWLTSELVFIAVGTASILFDGLSQTQIWFDLFGVPSLAAGTVELAIFLAAIAGLVLLVSRVVGLRAMAAGLAPIALGYLIAHYFTALAFDGQRIVTVASDPFNAGWNLFGTATFEPNETWLPYGIVWAVELMAVVGGHVFGAVMGHRAAVLDAEYGQPQAPATVSVPSTGRRPVGSSRSGGRQKGRGAAVPAPARAPARRTGVWADVRARQVPLAILMVFLTTLTLWSLGQNLVQAPAAPAAVVVPARPAA